MIKASTALTKVAYLVQSHPIITIFDEVHALRQAGIEVGVFSFDGAYLTELHTPDDSTLSRQTTYHWHSPQNKAAILQSNLTLLANIGSARYQAAFAFAKAARLLPTFEAFTQFVGHAYRLKRRGFTHLHAHFATEASTVAMIFSWLTQLPFSFTAHDHDIFTKPQYLAQKLAQASFIVTISGYNKKYLVNTLGPKMIGAELENKIHVIYPFLNLDQIPVRPAPPKNDVLSILSCGPLISQKGFIYLIEACRILQERGTPFQCQIIGQGDAHADLQATIGAYGLYNSVKLLGSVPYQTRFSLLEKATVFALPCVIAHDGARDGMPQVLIESLAKGVPIITSDVVGLGELVGKEAGLLVPPHNPETLANALIRVYQGGPDYQQTMGLAGRRIAEAELDAARNVAKLTALFANSQVHPNSVTQQPDIHQQIHCPSNPSG